TWETPQFGGLLGSCHALDIPFVFHNLGRSGVEAFTGNGEARTRVADCFSTAVTSFARNGNPGWDRYDLNRRTTMRIDSDPHTIDDPEPDLRLLWSPAA
ncbi:MAG: carboxylesterase family protein, partial [Actinobacteria bacterium]|nr:carboxylesterase family protein [Actinomycetota bacterium]